MNATKGLSPVEKTPTGLRTRFYPVFLDVVGKSCVVVGGGEVAERKVEMLLACGAEVTVVSPEVAPGLASLCAQGSIRHQKVEFSDSCLEGAFLVIGATDDKNVNEAVWRECQRLHLLVNVVDAPELCNFIAPAVFQQGDLLISISTSGKSPTLAKKIRQDLESRYGPEYAELLEILGEMRERVFSVVPEVERRKEVFERLVASEILDLLRRGDAEQARLRAEEIVRQMVKSVRG